ncbi:sensor domain-containing diguanylate cyclase [Erythrobacter ani]|uniref:Diguanylate cyclase n=1 Tax=Erythrobacter ani TaxID=2827235 RepID=A0ABS6SLN4_9SPHN|nr:sensor domain-containing diguanylate cyclase [Erythrobacter ani]MBV7265890.1 diguanylate cyclase [Erythrobacter ani]
MSDLEGRVLHGLVEEASGDIVLRLDAQGFIVHGSENISELGYDIAGMLVMPHVSDLADGEHSDLVGAFVEKTMKGEAESRWCEFPVIANAPASVFDPADYRRWYSLSLRPITAEGGTAQGALGLLRSVQHKRVLEGELHSRAVTDPLTGLANRQAFCANLRRHLAAGGGQLLAVFAVDSMRAMFMQYGQRTADEIMWGFAKFLETMALPGHEIAQLDHERFAVILPNMSASAAREWAGDVLKTFSALALPSSSRGPQLSASAGLATVECTVDWTLRQAELSLVMARAGGGMQVGHCGYDMSGAVAARQNASNGASPVGVAAAPR